MDLKEFVAQTLSEINQGVKEARSRQDAGDEAVIGGSVHYLGGGGTSDHLVNLDSGSAAHLVHFDVALTVTNSGSASGSGKVAVASMFSFAATAGGEREHSEVSRMRFTVPISFEKRKRV